MSSFKRSQIKPSLREVYEAEIRHLRAESHYLRIQHNSIVAQLNVVLAQLQQVNAESTLLKQRTGDILKMFSTTQNRTSGN